MKIEHFAYQVEAPKLIAAWYCNHLNFIIKRHADHPILVYFLSDETGQVMIEIYNNPKITVPDYYAMDPLTLHLAFVCTEVTKTVERLIKAGACLVSGPEIIVSGDELAMLRDPWGLSIQLCKRANPMI